MIMTWREYPAGVPCELHPEPRRDVWDPYLEWAERTRFMHFGGPHIWWIPVLLELEGMTGTEFARRAREFDAVIRVPTLFAQLPDGLRKLRFCTAYLSRNYRDNAGVRGLFEHVVGAEYGVPIVAHDPLEGLPGSVRSNGPAPSEMASRVVVGIIDDAIAFAHARFRTIDSMGAQRTRFRGFWQQDVSLVSRPLSPFGTGWMLESREIDELLQRYTLASGSIDEDALYRHIGHQGVGRRRTHGTHVLDLAAGCDPREVGVDTPGLVGVQLPSQVTRDTSGGTLTPYVFAGLIYIVLQARKDKDSLLPVVVNLSYGLSHGPHDGSTLLERAIDSMIVLLDSAGPLRVVLPAGNGFLNRGHARLVVASGAPERLTWRVLPDDRTPSFLEVWLPSQSRDPATSGVRVRVTPPGRASSPWVRPGGRATLETTAGPAATINYDPLVPRASRARILIDLAPTHSDDRTVPRSPSGNWIVELENNGPPVSVDAWIWRDDTPLGFRVRGRQSRFDDPGYELYQNPGGAPVVTDNASLIKRAGAFNGLATGQHPIVAGGALDSAKTVARYSGSGPTCSPLRAGPDVIAACDDSPALPGVQASGSRTGSRVLMNGTSTAAPQVTRWIAANLAAGGKGDRATIQASALMLSSSYPQPAERAGAGLISMPFAAPGRRGSRRSP